MRNLIFVFSLVITFSISQAQNAGLIGSWDIIEFGMVSDDNTNKTEEAQLKENGAIWSLFFMEKGKFKQTSNMRTGEIESQEGTWNTLEDILELEMQFNEKIIKLEYSFELKENILVLNRSNPRGTMKIVTKFRKK
jgi:hypothetical protein